MSYLVLARKWRPQTFDDVVGQLPIVRTLQNAISRNRVAHAMIFSGVRGVGKTTLARIMAKALNCQANDNRPCNHCESCLRITEGSALDLHEIDGASNRGIQEIRELKENIRFFPVTGRYKIIIIDEVHMLTTEAFNALLKTLEEPPEHVYFMFATTELHKVPITILSRCQRYELRRIQHAELTGFFKKISTAEEVVISDDALDLIAREAEGSVRDGLSLLDQVLSFGGAEIGLEDVSQVLGLVDRQVFAALSRSLLGGDLAGSLAILDRSFIAGLDLKRFSNDLLAYFRAILVAKISPQAQAILDLSERDLQGVREIADQHSTQTLYHYFASLLKGVEEMQYSTHPRLALEMAFIRAAQVGEVTPVATLLARLDALVHGLPGEPGAGGLEKKIPFPVTPPILEPPPVAKPAVAAGRVAAPALPLAEPGPAPGPKPAPLAARREVRENWDAFLAFVDSRKKWLGQALKRNAGVREDQGRLLIQFDDPADCLLMQESEHVRLLTEIAQDFFQRELKVSFEAQGRPADQEDEHAGDKPREDRRALANDPLVQMAAEVFGGQVTAIRTSGRGR